MSKTNDGKTKVHVLPHTKQDGTKVREHEQSILDKKRSEKKKYAARLSQSGASSHACWQHPSPFDDHGTAIPRLDWFEGWV